MKFCRSEKGRKICKIFKHRKKTLKVQIYINFRLLLLLHAEKSDSRIFVFVGL